MKILSNLTSKDYVDFGSEQSPSSNDHHHHHHQVQPVDVVVAGISVLLPLMTEELLKVSEYVYVCMDVFPRN